MENEFLFQLSLKCKLNLFFQNPNLKNFRRRKLFFLWSRRKLFFRQCSQTDNLTHQRVRNFQKNFETPKLNNCNERGEIETKRDSVIFHEDASSMLQVMLSNKPSEYKSHCIKKVNQRNVPLSKQVGRNCLMDRKNKRNSYFQFIFLLQSRYLGGRRGVVVLMETSFNKRLIDWCR